MKEEGKTEEEIQEFMEGKGTQYIDRVEYIIDAIEIKEKVALAINVL